MNLIGILYLMLFFLVFVAIILALVYFKMKMEEKSETKKTVEKNTTTKEKIKAYREYSVESIYNFMEFEKIQDNMIVQKNGKKFLMAIECQGINYDLMSEVEKNSVEMGFMRVLNTLREPTQIYVQTRTINLERSLERYKDKLKDAQNELTTKQMNLKKMIENSNYTEEDIRKQRLEVIRQENLCKYGEDIILNTERMSLNKNILVKKYFIITSYYVSNTDGEFADQEEIKDNAFSNLYTRCQSIVRALASAEVVGKILNSDELVDLLYNAYNRDESETFGINKAQEAGFDDLYVTAQDVLEKRMIALNEKIEKNALDLAEEAVLFAARETEIQEKEESLEDLINDFAKEIIEENRQYLGDEVTEKAKEQVDKKKKGEKKNAKKTTAKRAN